MIISIHETAEVPIYLQIRNQIVEGISRGELMPGDMLPSVRALAEEIGINSMTVNKSYQLLKQEGYLVTDRRKGAKIAEQFQQETGLSQENIRQLRCIIAEASIRGMTKEAFLAECESLFQKQKGE